MTLLLTQISPPALGESIPMKIQYEINFDLVGIILSGRTFIQKDPRDWMKYSEDAFDIPHNGRIEIQALEEREL